MRKYDQPKPEVTAGQKGDMIQRTITIKTPDGKEIDIPTLTFNPADRDSVHYALALVGKQFNDQPVLQQWIAGAIWDAHQSASGMTIQKCPICGKEGPPQTIKTMCEICGTRNRLLVRGHRTLCESCYYTQKDYTPKDTPPMRKRK